MSKRGEVSGFDGVQGSATSKRIKSWNKNQPSGRWRKIKRFKLKYTILNQTWYFQEKSFTKKHISPFGMKEFLKDLFSKERNTNKKGIPVDVKSQLGLDKEENFSKDDIKIVTEDEGDKGYDNFMVLYCEKCVAVSIELFLL